MGRRLTEKQLLISKLSHSAEEAVFLNDYTVEELRQMDRRVQHALAHPEPNPFLKKKSKRRRRK